MSGEWKFTETAPEFFTLIEGSTQHRALMPRDLAERLAARLNAADAMEAERHAMLAQMEISVRTNQNDLIVMQDGKWYAYQNDPACSFESIGGETLYDENRRPRAFESFTDAYWALGYAPRIDAVLGAGGAGKTEVNNGN